MSPIVFREGKFVFWFHSYDVLHESRASIHVGKVRKTMQVTLKSGWSHRLKSEDLGVR